MTELLAPRLTSFVGREADVRAVGELLTDHRLVTISGPGGLGKTSLAGQVLLGEARPVAAVDLATISEGSEVAALVARALRVAEQSVRSARDQVIRYLGDRSQVLYVDNCEHVRDGVRDLVLAVLQACPNVAVLATSTVRLDVPGECLYDLAPLGVPDDATTAPEVLGTDSVRLLLDRARQLVPDFAVTAANLDDVRRLCQRLDGIPWPSSWRPCGCGCCRWPSSTAGSTTGSPSSRAAAARAPNGTGPCAPWSTGAMSAAPRTNGRCGRGCRCSPARSGWKPPKRSADTGSWPGTGCWTPSPAWSSGRSSWWTGSATGSATGNSPPCATTARPSWHSAVRRTPWPTCSTSAPPAPVTWSSTGVGPTRPNPSPSGGSSTRPCWPRSPRRWPGPTGSTPRPNCSPCCAITGSPAAS